MSTPDPARIAMQLMHQKDVPLWSLSDSFLIEQIAFNRPVKRGRNSQFVFTLLKFLNFPVFHTLILFFVGLAEATRWWWADFSMATKNFPTRARIFVGFGAASEENYWREFQTESGIAAIRISQARPGGQKGLANVNYFRLIKNIYCNAAEVVSSHKNAKGLVHQHKLDFLTITAARIGTYSYYLSWWQTIKPYHPTEIVFMSPDAPANACVAAELQNIVFVQHGLLRKSLVYPNLQRIKLITLDEVDFIKNLLPDAVLSTKTIAPIVNEHKNTVIIATHITKSIGLADNFIEWALTKGLKVIIRPHPCDKQDYSADKFAGVVVSNTNESFSELLAKEQPLFVVSWFSTVIAEAPFQNILPITLIKEDSEEIIDFIFPFHDRALSWPTDISLIEKAMEDRGKYHALIQSIKTREAINV